jgi:hypothetical protein
LVKIFGAKISLSELKELQEIYKSDWPLHVITHNTFKNFIHRFEKFPEWKNKVIFWSLNGDWKKHGTFVMVNSQTNIATNWLQQKHDVHKHSRPFQTFGV